MKYYCQVFSCSEEEGGGYWLKFPDFYCCSDEGENLEEALGRAKNALNSHLKCLINAYDTIPNPTNYEGIEGYYGVEVDPIISERIVQLKTQEPLKIH